MSFHRLIRAHDNHNHPIINVADPLLPRTYFNLVHLEAGESHTEKLAEYETCWVLWSGKADIQVDDTLFDAVGDRADIWASRRADSVYVPIGARATATALDGGAVLAIAGGRCLTRHEAYRIRPEEVRSVEVGSLETHSKRSIYHILGAKDVGKTGNLLVSELYAEPGCWSGYPPHKHGDDIPDGNGNWHETGFEEAYHFRFNPDNGFGAQYCLGPDDSGDVLKTRSGDTVLIAKGYHPTVASPGHAEYIFTILVGHTQHSLVQYFDRRYAYLANQLPGVKDMVALFTGDQR